MTKNQAKIILLQHFNCDSDIVLAGLLDITRQAVHKWKPDAPIALAYQWMLYGIHPEVFPKPELHDFTRAHTRQSPSRNDNNQP